MLLKLTRCQRTTAVKGTAVFMLDARVHLMPTEHDSVSKYRLGKEIIYNSAASERHLAAVDSHLSAGSWRGNAAALGHGLMARFNLNISINSLIQGTHIECKSLEELMGAEQAVITACKNLKAYLDTAATFDGRDILLNFDDGEPKIVRPETPPLEIAYEPTLALPALGVDDIEPTRPEIAGLWENVMDWWREASSAKIVGLFAVVTLLVVAGVIGFALWPHHPAHPVCYWDQQKQTDVCFDLGK